MSLKRALGPFDATMVVVGGIIGAGIFINPYIVAQRLVGNEGAATVPLPPCRWRLRRSQR